MMKFSTSKCSIGLLLTLALGFTGCASTETKPDDVRSTGYETKIQYDSNTLMMKNSEQIGEAVRKKIQQARDIQAKQEVDDDRGIVAEPDAIEALQDATRIVLSRPDQDGTVSNMFTRLRRELTDLGAFDEVMGDLTTESIHALESSSTPVNHQATYIVILQNLMAELRPEIGSNPKFKKIIEQIRDADIEVSDAVKNQQRLRSMSRPISPSETAAQILPKKK